jgi:hypothetical protein
MWLEDAKKATAHMARYGNSKESTRFFIDQINGDMFARREGYPKITRDEPLLGLLLLRGLRRLPRHEEVGRLHLRYLA